MNEDYFALDIDLLPQLLVACINEFDPTMMGASRGANTWLQTVCNNLNINNNLQTLLKDRAALQHQVAPQVDPAASPPSTTQHGPTPQAGAPEAHTPSAPVVSSSTSIDANSAG